MEIVNNDWVIKIIILGLVFGLLFLTEKIDKRVNSEEIMEIKLKDIKDKMNKEE